MNLEFRVLFLPSGRVSVPNISGPFFFCFLLNFFPLYHIVCWFVVYLFDQVMTSLILLSM